MKLRVRVKAKVIPSSYHFMFVSCGKAALELSKSESVRKLYEFDGKSNKKSKDFTFAVYLHDYVKRDDEFDIHGEVQWIISSSSPEFILHMYNGLLNLGKYAYKGYELEIGKIDLIQEKLPQSESATFRTLSPIHIKNGFGKEVDPFHENYEKELNYIANKTIENATGQSLKRPILFKPITLEKVVVKQQHDKFKSVNASGILTVGAYKGLFHLEGDCEDLQLLTQLGIGFRRNQGFGCIEYVQ